MHRIKLTPSQIAHAEWALEPMRDCADDEDFDYEENDLPHVENDELVFPTKNRAVMEDMVYRLSEQLPDTAKDDHDARFEGMFRHGSSVRAAARLADKIRALYETASPEAAPPKTPDQIRAINKTKYKMLDKLAADPRVVDIWDEREDGIWALLAPGYNADGCSCLHEWTVKGLLASVDRISKGDPH